MGWLNSLVKTMFANTNQCDTSPFMIRKLATIYWLLMLLVLGYVIVYTLIMQKGYQAFENVKGSTSGKVKGSACIGNLTNYKDIMELIPLDSVDLVIPANEEGSLFHVNIFSLFACIHYSILISIINQERHQESLQEIKQGKFVTAIMMSPSAQLKMHQSVNKDCFAPMSQGLFTGKCGNNGRCQMV